MEIYLHIPFCKKKCLYCDFNSYANCTHELIFSYLTALNREIKLAGKEFGTAGKNKKITSIFIGGGTPSLVDATLVKDTLYTVKSCFEIDKDVEISIEANPESLTEQKLEIYKSAGVNRLSMGVQSLYDDNLNAIGRVHYVETAKHAVCLAKKYFDNLSCDLMVGLPFDTLERVRDEVEELAKICSHISVYQLILEEGTPLVELVSNKKIKLPNDDETADLMSAAIATLSSCGFDRYEVSNFSKDGKFSLHNFGYWTREEYLGIGAGAASFLKLKGEEPFDAEIRFSSFNSIEEYICAVNSADTYFAIERASFEKLDADAIVDEIIMLGLRTSLGVQKSLISSSVLKKYANYLVVDGDKVHLNDNGFEIMNTILVDAMKLS